MYRSHAPRMIILYQHWKNDKNSPVVPTLIKDGSIDTPHNSCQVDMGCRRLQARDLLARRARNSQLIHHWKNDKNSPVVPTYIRDGSVGTPHNSCQIDIGCQWLQAWDYLARHVRNPHLIQHWKNDENSPVVPTLIRDGSVGTPHNNCHMDIGCQRLQAWDYLARCAGMIIL